METTTSPPKSSTALDAFLDGPDTIATGKLTGTETFWRDHYQFLKDHGYTLRRRYQPDWVASWLNTSKTWYNCEDGVTIAFGQALDATRADGSLVVLKRVDITLFPEEIAVGKLFSGQFSSHPENRCVPILDVIQPREGSKYAFLVMPLLFRTTFTPFETIGEVVEFFRQIFEVLSCYSN